MSRKKSMSSAAVMNQRTYHYYLNRLRAVAMSMFHWEGLPDTVNERFLEMTLLENGLALFFKDPDLGELALPATLGGKMNVYDIPTVRRAYAANDYRASLNQNDSVVIWDNVWHGVIVGDLEMFAQRLMDIERSIDVNVKQQKTPLIIRTTENQRLTMKNLFMQIDDNEYVIFGDKALDLDGVKVLRTDSPYVADKLESLRKQKWHEALSYLGIENNDSEKKERLVTGEVLSNSGNVSSQRDIRMVVRQQACDEINRMFGLNVSVSYRQPVYTLSDMDYTDGNDVEGGEANEQVYD